MRMLRSRLIPGNHEFYSMSRVDGLKVAIDMETSLHGRLTVMDGQQRRVDVDDKTILLACTLHSSGAPESGYLINDFHYVTDWSPQKQTDAHKAD